VTHSRQIGGSCSLAWRNHHHPSTACQENIASYHIKQAKDEGNRKERSHANKGETSRATEGEGRVVSAKKGETSHATEGEGRVASAKEKITKTMSSASKPRRPAPAPRKRQDTPLQEKSMEKRQRKVKFQVGKAESTIPQMARGSAFDTGRSTSRHDARRQELEEPPDSDEADEKENAADYSDTDLSVSSSSSGEVPL
jgi:hypothetical protein